MLVEKGGQYYLPLRLVKEAEVQKKKKEIQFTKVNTDTVIAELDPMPLPTKTSRWYLVEWCCFEESWMSKTFLEHGQQALRLGLFNTDLRHEEEHAGGPCGFYIADPKVGMCCDA